MGNNKIKLLDFRCFQASFKPKKSFDLNFCKINSAKNCKHLNICSGSHLLVLERQIKNKLEQSCQNYGNNAGVKNICTTEIGKELRNLTTNTRKRISKLPAMS